MTEQQLGKKIQVYLKSRGAYVIKTIATNRAGVPDIIACYGGKYIAIEVKLPKGVVSRLQDAHLQQIKEAGGVAIVARSVEDVEELF